MVFETVYAAFSACEQYMSKYLVDRADIYIYSVDFGQVKSSLCGNHAKMVSELCLIFGEIIRTRSGLLKAWLSKSIGELSGLVIRIDDFVVQKGNLERISAEITQKREEISILKQLLGILDSSAHSNILSKEQKDVIADLNSLSSSLFLTISDAENQLPKYI